MHAYIHNTYVYAYVYAYIHIYIARPSKGDDDHNIKIVHRWWVRIWLNKPIRAWNFLPHVGQTKLLSSRCRLLICLCLRSSLFFSALAILLFSNTMPPLRMRLLQVGLSSAACSQLPGSIWKFFMVTFKVSL